MAEGLRTFLKQRRPVSASKLKWTIRATVCEPNDQVDGGYFFPREATCDLVLDPVDLLEGLEAELSDSKEKTAYFSLLVRAQEVELKNRALWMAMLPFSMDWMSLAEFRPPYSGGKSKKEKIIRKALADSISPHAHMDHKPEIFVSKKSTRIGSSENKEVFARLQVPFRKFSDVVGLRSDYEDRKCLWGILPLGVRTEDQLEQCVSNLYEASELLKNALERAYTTFRGWRGVHARELEERAVAECLVAAVWKAFAGPVEFEEKSGTKDGWKNQPVSHLALEYFREILSRYDERFETWLKKRPKTGVSDWLENLPEESSSLEG